MPSSLGFAFSQKPGIDAMSPRRGRVGVSVQVGFGAGAGAGAATDAGAGAGAAAAAGAGAGASAAVSAALALQCSGTMTARDGGAAHVQQLLCLQACSLSSGVALSRLSQCSFPVLVATCRVAPGSIHRMIRAVTD